MRGGGVGKEKVWGLWDGRAVSSVVCQDHRLCSRGMNVGYSRQQLGQRSMPVN